jgi:hypothetical protein
MEEVTINILVTHLPLEETPQEVKRLVLLLPEELVSLEEVERLFKRIKNEQPNVIKLDDQPRLRGSSKLSNALENYFAS